ncbi:hypothetical protein E1A91_D13G105400v1 [Gossypium mustelinum]|uniref:Uncharacterized protein n=4 Tax=Gossypium TaxID=3633 RepID=A0A5J5NK04_GOSBA|nr:hypothetical protein ES319_D13G102700v1 [Gossypium barbadense]TYG37012.1 hypothetical protein ES288_D13G108500v1 [Gossypium darwinii]TYH34162.1 hypothetical protein ES332_D13G109900v1 [Gossypium tomentosum]TYI46405.1 hypothetical protein E1A91_D13G105400v1 [Gossypium mustelinum]
MNILLKILKPFLQLVSYTSQHFPQKQATLKSIWLTLAYLSFLSRKLSFTFSF